MAWTQIRNREPLVADRARDRRAVKRRAKCGTVVAGGRLYVDFIEQAERISFPFALQFKATPLANAIFRSLVAAPK